MRRAILLAIAATATLCGAAPALAQTFFRPPVPVQASFFPSLDQRIGFLGGRVDEGQRSGMIGWRAALALRNQLIEIRWMEQRDRFQNGGALTPWQRIELSQRLDALAGELNFEGR